MKFDLKKNTTGILFELFTVTLGVFIALAINSWYESHQNKQKSYELLERIEQELLSNQPKLAELDRNIKASQKQVDDRQEKLEQAIESKEINIETGNLTTYYQVLQFDVWKLSQNRKEVSELPVDLIAHIGKAHRYTEELARSNRKIIEVIAELRHNNEYDAKTLQEKLVYTELLENKLSIFHLDVMLAKMSNENALTAIYEYAPEIKKKRETLNSQNKAEDQTETLTGQDDNTGDKQTS